MFFSFCRVGWHAAPPHGFDRQKRKIKSSRTCVILGDTAISYRTAAECQIKNPLEFFHNGGNN